MRIKPPYVRNTFHFEINGLVRAKERDQNKDGDKYRYREINTYIYFWILQILYR